MGCSPQQHNPGLGNLLTHEKSTCAPPTTSFPASASEIQFALSLCKQTSLCFYRALKTNSPWLWHGCSWLKAPCRQGDSRRGDEASHLLPKSKLSQGELHCQPLGQNGTFLLPTSPHLFKPRTVFSYQFTCNKVLNKSFTVIHRVSLDM